MSRGRRVPPPVPFDDAPMRAYLAHLIVTRREAVGWSQAEAARLIGCTPGALSRFENGRGYLSMPHLLYLLELLDIPLLPFPLSVHSPLREAFELLCQLSPRQLPALLRFLREAYLPPTRGTRRDLGRSSWDCEGLRV